jgi:hypothetical protein
MDVKKIANILLAIFLIMSGVYYFSPIVMTISYFMYATGILGIIAGLLVLFASFRG